MPRILFLQRITYVIAQIAFKIQYSYVQGCGDPDPYYFGKLDPDPQKLDPDSGHRRSQKSGAVEAQN